MPFYKIQLNSEYSTFPFELKRKNCCISHTYAYTPGCIGIEYMCQHAHNLLIAVASKKG